MKQLQSFFSGSWCMRRTDFEAMTAVLLPAVINGRLDEAEKFLATVKVSGSALGPNLASWYDLDDEDLPEDSVAVLNLYGTLYSWESAWLAESVRRADENPNICGVVLVINGPGGMVAGVDQAVASIKNCSKPTATVVSGCMASAHFWIGSSTGRTFIASDLSEVGSVGTMITYLSYKEYFKKEGIDFREIYPDSADLKNKEVRALEDNDDETPMKDRLAHIHRIFAETVAENLGIAYDPELPLFRGEMFWAPEALEMGIVDERGCVEDAVRWVLAQAVTKKANTLY